MWHGGGLQGEGEEDSCYRTSWVGTGTTLAWVSQCGLGTGIVSSAEGTCA